MRAYNEDWVYNREILRQAERWHRQRLLTDEQWATVEQTYPSEFRQTNGFLDIGLFLFATLGILGAYLLISTVLAGLLFSDRVFYGIFNLIAGVAVGVLGRLLAKQQRLYRNGTDNAFVATMTGFLAFGFNQLLPTGWSVAVYCLATLPLLLLIFWSYGDTLIAFLTAAAFYAFVFDGMLRFSWGKDALPFVMMGVSIALFQLIKRRRYVNPKTHAYYADALNLTEWIALIVLAAGGNYYVVRELNALLLTPSPPIAPEIALPGLFWVLTFAIPLAYLQQGLTKRNRMLIILGALGLIAAVATVHEYTALVPLNVLLTLGGLALIGVAVAAIRYLHAGSPDESKHGFTDAPDEESLDGFRANAETLVAMQATAGASHASNDDLRFGEGNFGGGGAGERY